MNKENDLLTVWSMAAIQSTESLLQKVKTHQSAFNSYPSVESALDLIDILQKYVVANARTSMLSDVQHYLEESEENIDD